MYTYMILLLNVFASDCQRLKPLVSVNTYTVEWYAHMVCHGENIQSCIVIDNMNTYTITGSNNNYRNGQWQVQAGVCI